MLIETDPCQYCDFTPAICSGDIELCMIHRRLVRTVSSEQYEEQKEEWYKSLEKRDLNFRT